MSPARGRAACKTCRSRKQKCDGIRYVNKLQHQINQLLMLRGQRVRDVEALVRSVLGQQS
ncbi:hypothetical protein LB505_011958 [Fusarium chuoi]|nr:hypothetical protein LB505_011958 [Fusarium chuoi]